MKPYVAIFAAAFAVAAFSPGVYAMNTDSGSKSSAAPADPDYDMGKKAAMSGKYGDALASLNKVVERDPKNADAWNYIGFSDRKLGKYDESLAAYQKALAINPEHKGAIEYLGELYLQTGKLDMAKEQLAKLDRICTFGCDEYTALKKAINSGKVSWANPPKMDE